MTVLPKFLNKLKERKSEKGFTLIELIIVVAIIGILTAIGIPVYGMVQANAANATIKQVAKESLNAVLIDFAKDDRLGIENTLNNLNEDNKKISVLNTGGLSASTVCIEAEWRDETAGIKNVQIGPGCITD